MKLLSKHNLYVGTNAERLASFATPPHEGADFLETDTGDSYTFVYGAWEPVGGGGGATTFLGLTDVLEATYVGAGGQMVVVNGGETGLEFTATVPAHDIVGASHTASGLTTGNVIRATGATTFAWAQLQHSDLGGVGANDHHNQSHVLDGGDHTVSGLTTGHVLQALSPATFGFGAIPTHDIISTHSVAGSQYQVVGLTASNTLGVLTPSTTAANNALVQYGSGGQIETNYLGIGASPASNIGINQNIFYEGTVSIPQGAYLVLDVHPTSAPSYSQAYGWLSQVKLSTSDTLSELNAVYGLVSNTSTGTISTAAVFRAGPIGNSSGTVTEGIGVLVDDQTAATTNRAIKTGLGTVSLGDDLEFRQAATISTTAGVLTLDGAGGIVGDISGGQSVVIETTDDSSATLEFNVGSSAGTKFGFMLFKDQDVNKYGVIYSQSTGDWYLYDYASPRYVFRYDISPGPYFRLMETSGNIIFGNAAGTMGFYGGVGATKPTITGSRGGNAALASLLTALANLGLIVNSSTA